MFCLLKVQFVLCYNYNISKYFIAVFSAKVKENGKNYKRIVRRTQLLGKTP